MFGLEMIAIAFLALIGVAFGVVAIGKEVRRRKMDAHAAKIMER